MQTITEWVIGYTTDRGLMLDLDNTTPKQAFEFADREYRYWNLKGYLIMQSSKHNHSVIFNRRMTWKKVLRILNSIALNNFDNRALVVWVLLQGLKGAITVRVSGKGLHNSKPKILCQFGETDKIIKEYLRAFKIYRNKNVKCLVNNEVEEAAKNE